jgi:Bacteriocin-protection, YdeI or OmpD-Associated
MRVQRFRTRVAAGSRDSGVIAIPFDPDEVWGGKAAAAFFDTLAQFYRKAYLRYIDATTRRPDLRAAHIAEVVDLLAAGVKERSRPSRPR